MYRNYCSNRIPSISGLARLRSSHEVVHGFIDAVVVGQDIGRLGRDHVFYGGDEIAEPREIQFRLVRQHRFHDSLDDVRRLEDWQYVRGAEEIADRIRNDLLRLYPMEHAGVDIVGAHGRDFDPLLQREDFRSERLTEPNSAELRSAVVDEPRHSALPRHGGDRDDVAAILFQHRRKECLSGEEEGGRVDGHGLFHQHVGAFEQLLPRDDPGVVDEDVDIADVVLHSFRYSVDLFSIAQIDGESVSLKEFKSCRVIIFNHSITTSPYMPHRVV